MPPKKKSTNGNTSEPAPKPKPAPKQKKVKVMTNMENEDADALIDNFKAKLSELKIEVEDELDTLPAAPTPNNSPRQSQSEIAPIKTPEQTPKEQAPEPAPKPIDIEIRKLLMQKKSNLCNFLISYATSTEEKDALNRLKKVDYPSFIVFIESQLIPYRHKMDDLVLSFINSNNIELPEEVLKLAMEKVKAYLLCFIDLVSDE